MKWEYKTTKIPYGNFKSGDFKLPGHNAVDEFLSEFGSAGWELVSTIALIPPFALGEPYTDEVILFFKRPVIETNE